MTNECNMFTTENKSDNIQGTLRVRRKEQQIPVVGFFIDNCFHGDSCYGPRENSWR